MFFVLWGFWAGNFAAFNGDSVRGLAAQFLALAEKQTGAAPLMLGHRVMGVSLLFTGDVAEGDEHQDRAIALYDPAKHRSLAMQFGQDSSVTIRSYRSVSLWLLGHPEAARTDVERALADAREIGLAVTLMYALNLTQLTRFPLGQYEAAKAQVDEAVVLADKKGALFWQALGVMIQGCVSRPDRQNPSRRGFVDYLRRSQPTGQQAQQCSRRLFCHIWREPMLKLGQFDEASALQ